MTCWWYLRSGVRKLLPYGSVQDGTSPKDITAHQWRVFHPPVWKEGGLSPAQGVVGGHVAVRRVGQREVQVAVQVAVVFVLVEEAREEVGGEGNEESLE